MRLLKDYIPVLLTYTNRGGKIISLYGVQDGSIIHIGSDAYFLGLLSNSGTLYKSLSDSVMGSIKIGTCTSVKILID